MLLGIGLHAALSFFPIPWIVQDTRQNPLFGLGTAAIHGFRMPLFFLISGFFTMMLYRKRGLVPLLRQRALRILLPCLLGLVTIGPLLHYVSAWAVRSAAAPSGPSQLTVADAVRQGDKRLIGVLLLNDHSSHMAPTPKPEITHKTKRSNPRRPIGPRLQHSSVTWGCRNRIEPHLSRGEVRSAICWPNSRIRCRNRRWRNVRLQRQHPR
jgi:hypothetical protein